MSNKPSQQQPAEETSKLRAPTTISPTDEELEREARAAFERYMYQTTDWYYTKHPDYMEGYLAAAKRYTRQGGEDWEALYISEHLNLLAAKGRIAELEKEITEWKWKLNDAKVINERLISDDHASGWLGLSDEDLGKTVRQYFETLNK